MSKLKINFAKIGESAMSLLKANAGPIVGGLSMIALGILCQKLDLPYNILTDPYTVSRKTMYTPRVNQTAQSMIMLVPNNATEASIAAIVNSAKNMDYDSQKVSAAKQVMSVLSSNKDNLTEASKTFAITMLQNLTSELDYDSNINAVNDLIMKVGKGEF